MLVLNSLCSWGCPGSPDPPAFIFWELGLWVCTTTFGFMKLWGLNPWMPECLATILPTEPHPRPKEKTPHLSPTETYSIFNTLLLTPALLFCSFTSFHWQISAASEWLSWSLLWYILKTPAPPFSPLQAPLGMKFWKLPGILSFIFPLKDVTVES